MFKLYSYLLEATYLNYTRLQSDILNVHFSFNKIYLNIINASYSQRPKSIPPKHHNV